MAHTNSKVLSAALTLLVLAAAVSASDLRPGEAVVGSLAPEAAQAFRLDCARGDTVKITMKAKGAGDHAPDITICDPSGDVVTAARGSRKNKASFTAAQTGTYEVWVRAIAGSSARYRMKVKGEKKRTHAAAAAEISFGAPAGAEVRFKAKGARSAEMRDGRGQQIDLLQSGARFRSSILARTDEYRIAAPGASKIKVKVEYADARDALVVTSPGSRYDVDSGQVPAVVSPDTPDAPAADAGDDGAETEGEVPDPANDGTVPGTGGDGTVPAPSVPADHAYLIALLSAEEDVDVQKARIEMDGAEDQQPAEFAADLLGRFPDRVALDLADALLALGDEMVGAEARAYALDIVAAQRRADRARDRLAALEEQRAGSALMGDLAFDAGIAALLAEMARTEAAVAQALESGLVRRVRGEEDLEAASLDAAEAPAPSAQSHAGLAAMDAALANGLLQRAREGDRAAREALSILTAAYEQALAAFPGQDANPAATRAALDQRQAELAALAADFGDFDLAAEPMTAPLADEDYEIVVRALGADVQAMDWVIDGAAEHSGAIEADGLRLAVPGHADERIIEVRAYLGSRERVLRIHVQPVPAADEAPAGALIGLVFGDDDQPMAHLPIVVLLDDEVVAAGQTDAEGRFEIDGLSEGEAVLRIGHVEMPVEIVPHAQDLGPIHIH